MRNVVLCVFGALQIMFVALATQNAIAQHAIPITSTATSLYIENKGQIGDQHGKPNHDVRFLILRPGLNIQLRQNGFSYDSYTVDRCELPEDTALRYLPAKFQDRPNEEITYRFHRVDVDLVGANPKPLITATGASSDYLNYYTHITQQVHGDKGATDVRGYARVTYHDVWPGVDMEWFIDDQQRPEYQFVIRPGGNVAAIQLRYRGAHGTRLDEEHLVLDVQHGPIRESLPRSYVQSTGSTVDVRYRALGGDVYGFTVPPIDIAMGETLVIDPVPEIVWGHVLYAINSVEGRELAITKNGLVVIVGATSSADNISTSGSHQDSFAGSTDAFVTCMTQSRDVKWSTYYGGSEVDVARSVTAEEHGFVAVAGTTLSRNGMATEGSHSERGQVAANDSSDCFIARFNALGRIRWATYLGGDGDDRNVYVRATQNGRLVVVLETDSKTGLTTENTHKRQYNDSNTISMTAVVTLDTSGTLLSGSYYGGEGATTPYAVDIGPSNIVYIGGRTSSQGDIATNGVHAETRESYLYDGYLAAFTTEGKQLWGTFLGSRIEGQVLDVAAMSNGSIGVVGITKDTCCFSSDSTRPTYNDGLRNDGYICMFDANGQREWCTHIENDGYDAIRRIVEISDSNIVIAGFTNSSNGIATFGAPSRVNLNRGRVFVMTLNSKRETLWGTYIPEVADASPIGVSSVVCTDDASLVMMFSASTKLNQYRTWATLLVKIDEGKPCPDMRINSIDVDIAGCFTKMITCRITGEEMDVINWAVLAIHRNGQIGDVPIFETTISDDRKQLSFSSSGGDYLVYVSYVDAVDSNCRIDTTVRIHVDNLPVPWISRLSASCSIGDTVSLEARVGDSLEPTSYPVVWHESDRYEIISGKNESRVKIRVLSSINVFASATVSFNKGCERAVGIAVPVNGRIEVPVVQTTGEWGHSRKCTMSKSRLSSVFEIGEFAWFVDGRKVSTEREHMPQQEGGYVLHSRVRECEGQSEEFVYLNHPDVRLSMASNGVAITAQTSTKRPRITWLRRHQNSWVPIPGVGSASASYTPSDTGWYGAYVESEILQSCRSTVDSIYYSGSVALSVSLYSSALVLCDPDSVRVVARVSGGLSPYSIRWMNADRPMESTDSVALVYVDTTRTVIATVVDSWGNRSVDSVRIRVVSPPVVLVDSIRGRLFAVNQSADSVVWITAQGHSVARGVFFEPLRRESYRAIIYDGECVDTSEATSVNLRMRLQMQPIITTIRPNPASSTVAVLVSSDAEGQIVVSDHIGRVVARARVERGTGETFIDVKSLSPACYYLRVVTIENNIVGVSETKMLVVMPE